MKNGITMTVITVCFNAADTIERTIDSVLSQSYPDVEYIIVDGGSTDGTIEIVKKYSKDIAHFISEKDNGIFDAMNKGVKLSSGEVIYFLNADDFFCDDYVLINAALAFAEDASRLLVYGDVVLAGVPKDLVVGLAKPFKTWSISEFLHNSFCHQAVFARRSLFSDIGTFDCRYKYAADYLWIVKAFKFKPKSFFYIKRKIAHYFYLGRSYQQVDVTRREVTKIHFEHLYSWAVVWFFIRYNLIRRLKKKLLNEKY